MTVFSTALATAAAAASAAARPFEAATDAHPKYEPIPGEYLIVFEDDVSMDMLAVHDSEIAKAGAEIITTYDISPEFRGFAFKANSTHTDDLLRASNAAAAFEKMDHVAYVEQDQRMFASYDTTSKADSCNIQSRAPWGISRVSANEPNTDKYKYSGEAGEGMTVYIIDTGINRNHVEFEGRITELFDVYNNNPDSNEYASDRNGHGTHVAGTTAGATVGIAKFASIAAAKVLSNDGSGSNAGVIEGVAWACASGEGRPALNKRTANMSLGGGKSRALNEAVKACVDKGMPFIVAAGNEAMDACRASPASSPAAITVMSSTSSDGFSSFSNFGTCAEIIAPGSDIYSAWYTGDSAYATISGTSMASPHVCGVATLVLAANPDFSSQQIQDFMVENGNQGKIKRVPSKSVNTLVHSECI